MVVFLAGDFLAVDLVAGLFFAAAVDFLAGDFLGVVVFLAGDFLAAALVVVLFLTGAFFAVLVLDVVVLFADAFLTAFLAAEVALLTTVFGDFLAVLFLVAVDLLVALLVDFVVVFLAGALAALLVEDFFAVDFFAGDFLAVAFVVAATRVSVSMSRPCVGLPMAGAAERPPLPMILATSAREVNEFTQLMCVSRHRLVRHPSRSDEAGDRLSPCAQRESRDTLAPQEEMDVRHDLRDSGPFIGVGGMAVAAFLYGYTAIAFPSGLHSVGMPVFWLALFVWMTRWFTTRPLAVIALPVVAVAAWFAVLVGLGLRG